MNAFSFLSIICYLSCSCNAHAFLQPAVFVVVSGVFLNDTILVGTAAIAEICA